MQNTPASGESEREHLFRILKSFDRAMLITRAPDGGLHGRPMALAEVSDKGELYFATALDSGKVRELESDPHVNVAIQGKTQYVSLSGTARIIEDRELIDQLWSDTWKVWFPMGKRDPNLSIFGVQLSFGEYWDHGGAKGVRYLFRALKSYALGGAPETDHGINAKVGL